MSDVDTNDHGFALSDNAELGFVQRLVPPAEFEIDFQGYVRRFVMMVRGQAESRPFALRFELPSCPNPVRFPTMPRPGLLPKSVERRPRRRTRRGALARTDPRLATTGLCRSLSSICIVFCVVPS